MSHEFSFLRPGNPIHRSLMAHLVPQEPAKTAARRVALPESAVPVEERVLLRAFSDELEKIAFLGPIMSAARAGLPYALAGELGYEAVNRVVYPDAPRRSPLEMAKDVGTTLLFHAPMAAGLNRLSRVAKTAPTGSWSRWLAEKGHGPLALLEGFFNPKGQAAFRTALPLAEKALGVDKAPPVDPARMTAAQRGAPEDPLRPSYLQLRQMDPRAVSARYLS